MIKNLPANAGDRRDAGLIPGLGITPGGGHGNPLPYSCLENPMDRGAWQATVHRVAQSQTRLKRLSTHICQCRRRGLGPWLRNIPWRRKWQPTPVFMPGESHGQRSLAGYGPGGCKESDMTEQLTHPLSGEQNRH